MHALIRMPMSRACGPCITRGASGFSSPFYQNEVLERYGAIESKLITLRQLTVFGRRLTQDKLLKSANYLRTELPVR
jgi:hypothetical protein